MSEKLKPCPFCGEKDEIRHGDRRGTRWAMMYCDECGATGPDAETDADAITAWNRRHGETDD